MYQWGLLLEAFSCTSVKPFQSSNLTRFAEFHARFGRFALFHHIAQWTLYRSPWLLSHPPSPYSVCLRYCSGL
jgi:hypothetical protein